MCFQTKSGLSLTDCNAMSQIPLLEATTVSAKNKNKNEHKPSCTVANR